MNREHWKAMLPVIQAFVEGKTVQISQREGEDWKDIGDGATWMKEAGRYRIKPTPRLRPWKPEEVPVGAVVRAKEAIGPLRRFVIVGVTESAAIVLGDGSHFAPKGLLEVFELLDGSPCGVEVTE